MRFRDLFILIILIFMLVGVGCNKSLDTPNDEPLQDELEIIREVAIPIVNFKTLNPITSKDASVYYLDKLIYESLIDLDDSLTAVPLLAESWNYQNDGYELVFNLRKDVRWHDGEQFTSDDVVFTINTLLYNGKNEPSQFKQFVDNIKKAERIDDYTVKISFNRNYDNGIEKFIFPILSRKHVLSYGNIYDNTKDFFPIGTGLYKLEKIEKLKYIKLKSNENHWSNKETQNELVFKMVPSPEEAIGLLEIDDINMAFSQNSDWGKYLEDKTLSIYEFTSNDIEVLGFNFRNEILSDRRIRQAIAYSIDTEEIINNIYFGAGVKSDNLYMPDYLNSNNPKDIYAYNQQEAIRLLKEAGYENRDQDATLEDTNGKELSFNILVNIENKNRVDSAKIIKKSLDKIGISTNIIYIGYEEYMKYIQEGRFDIFLGGWSVSPLMDFRFALHSQYGNPIGYGNDYLDHLLVELQRHLSSEEKEKVFLEIKIILEQDMPYCALLYKDHAVIAKKSLSGNIEPSFFNLYNGAESWQIVKKP